MATVINWAGAAVRGLAWLAEVLRCTVMRGWPREGGEAVRRERGKMSSSAWDTEEVGAARAPIDTLCLTTQSAYYKDQRAGKKRGKSTRSGTTYIAVVMAAWCLGVACPRD